MSKDITKEQLVAALQLLINELDPKEVNLRDPGAHVLDFDKSFIANTQIENRGHWIEYLINHYLGKPNLNDMDIYEKLTAKELNMVMPIQWSNWYTPTEPKVTIFQVLNELTEKKTVLEIDYTIKIDGAYRVYSDEQTIRTVRYLDFGTINWRRRFEKTMGDINNWIYCHLETVDNYERGAICDYISRYILGFIGYLADASVYNSNISTGPKSNAQVCIAHILDTAGVYVKKKPKRCVTIKIHNVRAYDPLPEDIDLNVTHLNILRFDRPDIRYAILDTMCQYSYGNFIPHDVLNVENGKAKG